MSKLKNTIILHNGYVEVICENSEYKHSTLLDIEDLSKIGKVRISNHGYAYSGASNKSVAGLVLDFKSNKELVIDHINGNTLDNRKSNLRVCTQSENARNRHNFIRNNTGKVGIAYRENGNYKYYRVSVTDLKGVRRTKQFNINRLGKEVAFYAANEHLSKWKNEFGYI